MAAEEIFYTQPSSPTAYWKAEAIPLTAVHWQSHRNERQLLTWFLSETLEVVKPQNAEDFYLAVPVAWEAVGVDQICLI